MGRSAVDKYETWPSLRLYDRLEVPYVVIGGQADRWPGPLWTGFCAVLDVDCGYGDPEFFHELVHWAAASPAQRLLPDFGLGRRVNETATAFTSSATPHLHTADGDNVPHWIATGDRAAMGWGEPVVTAEVGGHQESIACWALFCYEPMVGLTAWGHAPDQLNSAAYDFNDLHPFSADARRIDLDTLAATAATLTAIDPTVTAGQVAAHLDAVGIATPGPSGS